MKKQSSVILKLICITCLSFIFILPVVAQKEKNQTVVTQQQISTINELVKPVKEQIEKLLNEDNTGNYKAYQEDVKKMNAANNNKEKYAASKQIREKYTSFFNKIWANAKVDEKLYQQKIKQAFPDAISSFIEFQPYLGFSISISTSKSSPPPQPPLPENKCIDVCAIAAGEINGDAGLISGGGGQYGNCFLRSSGWSAAAGMNFLYSSLKNNITIPGTFPNDARKLRVIKSYELKMEATSFAVLGFGLAETRANTYKTIEYLFVMSPVISVATKTITKSMREDYLLEKKDVALSIFKTSASTMAYLISSSWCYSQFSSIRWSICEEK